MVMTNKVQPHHPYLAITRSTSRGKKRLAVAKSQPRQLGMIFRDSYGLRQLAIASPGIQSKCAVLPVTSVRL